jgi:hypothetical protein
MKPFILSIALGCFLPVAATPEWREVIAPEEPMVSVPGLRHLGSSRISTVLFCVESELGRGKDWRNLITDSDFELIEGCLRAHT